MLLTLCDNCWTFKEPDNEAPGACIDPLVATLVRQVAWFFRGCRGLCYTFNAIGFGRDSPIRKDVSRVKFKFKTSGTVFFNSGEANSFRSLVLDCGRANSPDLP